MKILSLLLTIIVFAGAVYAVLMGGIMLSSVVQDGHPGQAGYLGSYIGSIALIVVGGILVLATGGLLIRRLF